MSIKFEYERQGFNCDNKTPNYQPRNLFSWAAEAINTVFFANLPESQSTRTRTEFPWASRPSITAKARTIGSDLVQLSLFRRMMLVRR